MERRERGEVPARFGGTREQGVRNTMSSIAPQGNAPAGAGAGGSGGGTGHLRRGGDPLDRMPAKGPGGGGEADRMMQERVAAMGGGAPPPTSGSTGPPSGIPT
jgi:ubiquitin-like protein 5